MPESLYGGEAFLGLPDGTQVPVTVSSFDFAASRPAHTLAEFALPKVDIGWKLEIDPETAEAIHGPLKDAPVDEAVDRQFDDWTCPGCGKSWDEVPVGHSWSLGFDLKTRKATSYSCSDPPDIDGEAALWEYLELGQRLTDGLEG